MWVPGFQIGPLLGLFELLLVYLDNNMVFLYKSICCQEHVDFMAYVMVMVMVMVLCQNKCLSVYMSYGNQTERS